MNVLKIVLKSVKIVQNALSVDLLTAAAWSAATDLGNLKGKPFVKLSWDQNTFDSQAGKQPSTINAKMESSTFEIGDATVLTALQTMRGLNISLQCTPVGTVSATNPIVIVKNFTLLIGGELNIGGESSIKLTGEREAPDENDIFAHDVSAA